jgi:hypothetical protein
MMSELEKALNAPNHESLAYLRRNISQKSDYKVRKSDSVLKLRDYELWALNSDTDYFFRFSDIAPLYEKFINKYHFNTTNLFKKIINHDDFIELFPIGTKQFQVKLIFSFSDVSDLWKTDSGAAYSAIYIASHVSNKHFDSYIGSSARAAEMYEINPNATFNNQECIFFFDTYEQMMCAEREMISSFGNFMHGHFQGVPEYGNINHSKNYGDNNWNWYMWLLNVVNGGQGRRPQKPFTNGLIWYCLNRFTKEVRFYDSMPYFGVRNCDWELKELKSWEAADREILAHLRKSLSLNLLNIRPHFSEILERMF